MGSKKSFRIIATSPSFQTADGILGDDVPKALLVRTAE